MVVSELTAPVADWQLTTRVWTARSHIVFFEEAKRLLPAADATLVARVEGARSTRNAMEYQAREVTQTEVDELTAAATRFIAAAQQYVQRSDAP